MKLPNGIHVHFSRECKSDTLIFKQWGHQNDLRNAHPLENNYGIYHLLEHMLVRNTDYVGGDTFFCYMTFTAQTVEELQLNAIVANNLAKRHQQAIAPPYTVETSANDLTALSHLVDLFYDEQYRPRFGRSNNYVLTLNDEYKHQLASVDNEYFHRFNASDNIIEFDLYDVDQSIAGNLDTLGHIPFNDFAEFMRDCWAAIDPKTDIILILGNQDIQQKTNLLKRTFGTIQPPVYKFSLPATQFPGSTFTPNYSAFELHNGPFATANFVLIDPPIHKLYAYLCLSDHVRIYYYFNATKMFVLTFFSPVLENGKADANAIADSLLMRNPELSKVNYPSQQNANLLAALFNYHPKDGEYPPCRRQLQRHAEVICDILLSRFDNNEYILTIPKYASIDKLENEAMQPLLDGPTIRDFVVESPLVGVIYRIDKLMSEYELIKMLNVLRQHDIIYNFNRRPTTGKFEILITNTRDNQALTQGLRKYLHDTTVGTVYMVGERQETT